MNQQIFTTIHWDGQYAVSKWVDNHLLVTEHDQNYTFFAVSVLFHKTGGGEVALIQGEALIKFWPEAGAVILRGHLRRGANSRIYRTRTDVPILMPNNCQMQYQLKCQSSMSQSFVIQFFRCLVLVEPTNRSQARIQQNLHRLCVAQSLLESCRYFQLSLQVISWKVT